ncbi:hypothetical protein VIH_000024 [Vibrio cholerae CT 5369-93]|nr:hypothetical protein VIH_000024 [Vibrio cholerae CT 5369-93]
MIYGFFIGAMVFLIRSWGGFPDGVAFARTARQHVRTAD